MEIHKMTNELIMRGIKEYVRRYRSEKTPIRREAICREVGFYLSNTTNGESDFMLYASEFLRRINEETMLERIKKSLEDWI